MPLLVLVLVVRRFDRSAKTFRYSTENNAWILISSSVTNDSISKSRVSNWCLRYNFKWFIIDNVKISPVKVFFSHLIIYCIQLYTYVCMWKVVSRKLLRPLATLEWTKRTNGTGYLEKICRNLFNRKWFLTVFLTVFLTCKHTTGLNINCIKRTLWAFACTTYSKAVYIYYYEKCNFTCIIIYIYLYLFTVLTFTIFTFRSFEIILSKSY